MTLPNLNKPSQEQIRQLAAAGYGILTEEEGDIATEMWYFIGVSDLEVMTDAEREQYGLVEWYEFARSRPD